MYAAEVHVCCQVFHADVAIIQTGLDGFLETGDEDGKGSRLFRPSPLPLPISEGSEYSQGKKEADELSTPLTYREGQGGGSEESASVPVFITRFKEAVEARLADSDASVEDLAADMNLSRVQLYRKVKATTGSSPVELLRTARLNRGYQLLLTTDLSISEVAYQVGFTAPSYFTKCFKEEYGLLPGDIKS